MKKNGKKLNYLALLLLSMTITKAFASEVESLSPDTRTLLQAEMKQLDNGFKELFTAYYSGDLKTVATIAKDIENSFILKKSLSDKQKRELHHTLPNNFLRMDQQFHYNAKMLSHVAQERKTELVGFYFSEMANGCFSCHSQYATHRFKNINEDKQPEHHH